MPRKEMYRQNEFVFYTKGIEFQLKKRNEIRKKQKLPPLKPIPIVSSGK